MQSTFRSISRKTPQMQAKVDKVLTQWNTLWNSSHLYIERLVTLHHTLYIYISSKNKVQLSSLFFKIVIRNLYS